MNSQLTVYDCANAAVHPVTLGLGISAMVIGDSELVFPFYKRSKDDHCL
ncbi:MAG TPA: hypothetical protein VFJ51_11605 [Nitrososphaeraceae archaeon]|nr:hypothetical protein [Nitrososphaeraceae archaeon]